MSQYEFDCFVCEKRIETNDLTALLAFMEPHADCGDEPAARPDTQHEQGADRG